MTGFDVTESQLQVSGSALESVAREARAAVGALGRDVEGLLASGWRGQAAAGFARGWEQWHNGAVEALSALAMMGELLADTGRGYGTTEQANYDGMSAVGGDL